MKKILPNTPKTKHYLDSLPKIYVVNCLAKYGVREFAFSGEYDCAAPLVWDYYDANGEKDEWHLRTIYQTTTGQVICWTEFKNIALHIANALNKYTNFDKEGIV